MLGHSLRVFENSAREMRSHVAGTSWSLNISTRPGQCAGRARRIRGQGHPFGSAPWGGLNCVTLIAENSVIQALTASGLAMPAT